jgi:spore germination protein YaaH
VSREVFGFAPYWSLGGAATWNYQLLTTVAYFGLDVRGDGSFDTGTPGWSGWNSQAFVDMVNTAHQNGDRVVLVVKAFDARTVNQIVTNPAAAQAAVGNALAAASAKNLDGVNVDFEGTSAGYPGVQSGMTAFMAQMSQRFHQWRPGAFVTVDTYSGSASWDGGIFKIGALAPVVDAIFVMAYDMVFSDLSGQAGPNAPLRPYPPYDDGDAVDQYLGKAPPSKVILGVPYYGYKWSTSSNQANAGTISGASADTYAGALSDAACASSHDLQFGSHWDGTAASPWVSWFSPAGGDPCGGNYGAWRELYYDDATSLGFKYDLVNGRGLRGTGMWALGYEGGSDDLWNELALKFSGVAGWSTLGGVLRGGPALASWASNRLDVLAHGTDDQVWHRWWTGSGWGGWESLGGSLAPGSAPAAVSWGPGRLDVFYQGADRQLWHRWYDDVAGWSSLEPLGGVLTSSAAVASWGAGRLDVFVRGTDSGLWHRWYDGGAWSGWEGLGGALTGAPGATGRGPGSVDVFARTSAGQLAHLWWGGGRWWGWEGLGGQLSSAPAASSWGPDRLDVAALGPGGDLRHLYWSGQWSLWLSAGGVGTSDPALVSPGPGAIEGAVRGTDGAAWITGLAA